MKKRLFSIFVLVLVVLSLIAIGGCEEKVVPVERIAITSLPKLNYLKGESFDLNNAKISIYYENGKNETIPLTLEMISDYNAQEIGEHILTVRYENVFTNIKITISNAPIAYVEEVEGVISGKKAYIEDQPFDVSNLKLQINYESGEPDVIDVTEDMISGYDATKIGIQEITITYGDNYETSFLIEVKQKSVSNISIAEIPNKKLYLIDEKITFESLAGGRLHIAYDNGYTETKDFSDLFQTQYELDQHLSYDTSYPESREIVRLSYENKSVIFDIVVLKKEATNITLTSLPSENQIIGMDLNLHGGQIYIEYNNKTSETLNMTSEKIVATGYDREVTGEQKITLSFNDIDNTFDFNINVIDTKPVSLEILLPILDNENNVVPYNSDVIDKITAPFYQEGTINLSLFQYRLKMDNGTYSAIYNVDNNMLNNELSDLVLNDYGTKNLTFSYIKDDVELLRNIAIQVIKKEVAGITVTPPNNPIYYLKEDLILTGATYEIKFNDGTSESGNIDRDMITVFNNTQLGYQDVVVQYKNADYGQISTTFKILIIKKAEEIVFNSVLKNEYILGEEFDFNGLIMQIHYENIVNPDLFSGPFGEEWIFTDTVFNELGNQYVHVQYQAQGLILETDIPVFIKNDLVSIELMKLVDENLQLINEFPTVVAGMNLDISDCFLNCTLQNGSQQIVLSKAMLNYNREDKSLGERIITISYGTKTINASVLVIERTILSLEMVREPEKEYYKAMVPSSLNINDLVMKLYYTNDTFVILDDSSLTEQTETNLVYEFNNEENNLEYITLDISSLDTTLPNGVEKEIKSITITKNQFFIDFDIIIAYNIATSLSWNIANEGEEEKTQPIINAFQGIEEIIFPSNSAFKVIYNEGESSEIKNINDILDEIEITNFNSNISGVQTIYIEYQDIKLSTIINVRAKDLKEIALCEDFEIPDTTEGMPLDLRKAKISVTYFHDMDTPDDTSDDIILEPSIISLSEGMTDYDINDNTIGERVIVIEYEYSGKTYVSKLLHYNINIKEKKLINIGMGIIPKTKYVELDLFDYEGGTIILYYNNGSNTILRLSDAKRVRNSSQILPTDYFVMNYGQFNNEDFTGFARKQQIFITYKDGEVSCKTSYDIMMHDRLNIIIDFEETENFVENTNTYYYWYGDQNDVNYKLMGYRQHSDVPDELTPIQLDLQLGINYNFKYIDDNTGEEFGTWPRNAGTYILQFSYEADSPVNNDRIHNSFVYDERKLIIQKKNINIAVNPITKVYGEYNKPYTSVISAVEYRENIDGTYEIIHHYENIFGYQDTIETLGEQHYTCIDNYENPISKATSIGTYTISVSVSENKNYNVTFTDANFVIQPREIMIIADKKDKIYGESDPLFTYSTATIIGNDKSGLIEGDTFSGYLLRQNASSNNGVGIYTILQGSLYNKNYIITYVSNTLTINKKNLILTAISYEKVYGQAMPLFNIEASSIDEKVFVYNDNIDSIGGGTLQYECKDDQNQNVTRATKVGTYNIIPYGLNSNNYDIHYNAGTISITQRKINIVAVDYQKIYGEEDVENFNYLVQNVPDIIESGLYAGDTINGSLEREFGNNVGDYAINCGSITNENNPNYYIIFNSGVQSIIRRDATIEITELSKHYDGELPSINNDGFILINAYGDIKDNITISFQNPTKDVGSYKIQFVNNDINHNITFKNPNGYIYSILQKEVKTSFYNIPYGKLANGLYTGSVYKGSPYYFEARVLAEDICNEDKINVVVYTAELEEGIENPLYLQKNNVTNVGKYSTKVMSLTNSNYKLKVSSPEEIEQFGDYKQTQFSIIPATIKINVTIANMSTIFTGADISFNNSINLIDEYYKSTDYQLMTKIDFKPNGLNVYPYYIDVYGNRKFPRNVLYKKDDFDEYIRDEEGNYKVFGYNIGIETGNENYTAILVDENGIELEKDENGEILNEDYRFKIIPREIQVILQTKGVTKYYDGMEPSIDTSTFGLSSAQVSKETEVFFEFNRIDEYPEFMENYITNKDRGIFEIKPFTTNMNYVLKLSQSTNYNYEIKKKILGSCDLGSLAKQYDGIKPFITSENFNFDNYSGNYVAVEKNELVPYYDFGDETEFNVNSYPFTLRFKFPYGNPDFHDGYDRYLDYNHEFVNSDILTKSFTITKREVKIILLQSDTQGFCWKYYNGLQGSQLLEGSGITDNFAQAYAIVDAKAYDPAYKNYMDTSKNLGTLENGDDIKVKHMLNKENNILLKDEIIGNLVLSNSLIKNAGMVSTILCTSITDNPVNNNFNITIPEGTSFNYEIKKQDVMYYIDNTSRTYGEYFSIYNYNFAFAEEERNKIVEEGELFGDNDALFNINNLAPRARDEDLHIVNEHFDVGTYDIYSSNYEFKNYNLIFDNEMSELKFEITRRELPVSFVKNYTNFLTVTRVYGDDVQKVIFNYSIDSGNHTGLMNWDVENDFIYSDTFDIPSFILEPGIGDNQNQDVGVINDAITLNYNLGNNKNYYFTYNDLQSKTVKLEIVKAPLTIKVVNGVYDGTEISANLSAIYGEEPNDFYFDYQGLKLGQNANDVIISDINSYILYAETINICGEDISFPQTTINISGLNLSQVVNVNFALPVIWDNINFVELPHKLIPYLKYNGEITRKAINGNYYTYKPEGIQVFPQNYEVYYDETDYKVLQREIDISLRLLMNGNCGEEARFNILWDEAPQLIDNEMILLNQYSQKQLLERKYTSENIIIYTLGIEEILLRSYDREDPDADPYIEILILAGKMSEEERDTITQAEIDSRYATMLESNFESVYLSYMNLTKIDHVYNGYNEYEGLSNDEIDFAYSNLITDEIINDIFMSEQYTDEEYNNIWNNVVSNLSDDENRFIYEYVFDESQFVYGDSPEKNENASIDISNIDIEYNTNVGENRTIKAKGVLGDNYKYHYVESEINIYNYVVSFGVNNDLPNIMISEDEDEFLVLANFVDGSSQYISFKNPQKSYAYINYTNSTDYIGNSINLSTLDSNQAIRINYNEQFFGYKEFSVDSEEFLVRVFKKENDLLWSNKLALENNFQGGTFADINNNTKDISDEFNANYTYYMSTKNADSNIIFAQYDFDILETKFSLYPKKNMDNFYYNIIINGNNQLTKYISLKLFGGNMEYIKFIISDTEKGLYNERNISKPATLDLFDGMPHTLKAYVDKLGTMEADSSGYNIVILIDNCYYYTFSIGKSYVPEDYSIAGFEINNLKAYISKFDVYSQGISSPRVLTIMPSSNNYYFHNYFTDSATFAIDLNEIIEPYTFKNSSYLLNNYLSHIRYEYYLDGISVSNEIVLRKGIYLVQADIFYCEKIMDTIVFEINVSKDYDIESISGKVPYISKPINYYGYNYDIVNDLIANGENPNTYSPNNNKIYKYMKMVFDVEIPTLDGTNYPDVSLPGTYNPMLDSEYDLPYNFAIILKTSNYNLDLRKPSNSSSSFNGIAFYVRYEGGVFYTRTYIRMQGEIYYSYESTEINWIGTERTVVEALFDNSNNTIIINIRTGSNSYTLEYEENMFMDSGSFLDENSIPSLISTASCTPSIKVKYAKIILYQMETGIRKISNFDFVDSNSQIISNTGYVDMCQGDKIFINNGSNMPLASDYKDFEFAFKANLDTTDPDYIENKTTYLKFMIGSKNPTFDNVSGERGIYLGYMCNVDDYGTAYKELSLNIFKNGRNYNRQKIYRTAEISTGERIGPDLFNGEVHTISVEIESALLIENSEYFLGDIKVYKVNIKVDGILYTNDNICYIPAKNDLSKWIVGNSISTDLDSYDGEFLPSLMYPGFNVIDNYVNVQMQINSVKIY